MVRRVAAVAGAGVAAATAAAALAGPVGDTIIGHKSASGRHASATALATTGPRPRAVYLRVKAKPSQRATGGWSAYCRLGLTGGARDADDFAGRTPITVRVRVPTDFASGGAPCKIVGTAALAHRGRVTVGLILRS